MIDYDPSVRATQFIDLQKTYEVIPPDDHNLGVDRFNQRLARRRDSIQALEYQDALAECLAGVPISPFFRAQIVHEHKLGYQTGWTRVDAVLTSNRVNYGIWIPNKVYGFFDPKLEPAVEQRYYQKVFAALQLRELTGIPNPVSWQDWAHYLEIK